MKKTLRNIHEELEIKQTLKNYVTNTNRKYHTAYLPDEVLSETTYFIIWFNTLGKLRRHSEQNTFMSKLLEAETKVELFESQVKQLSKTKKLASSILEKDSLKDAYIKTLKEYAFFEGKYEVKKRTFDFLTSIGVKYAEFITQEGIEQVFQDRIKWFENGIFKLEV